VSLLSWIMNTYTGPELMQHPELNIDTSSLGPLLNNSVTDALQRQYLKVGLYLHGHPGCTWTWVSCWQWRHDTDVALCHWQLSVQLHVRLFLINK